MIRQASTLVSVFLSHPFLFHVHAVGGESVVLEEEERLLQPHQLHRGGVRVDAAVVEQQLLDAGEPARSEAHPARRVAPCDAVGGLAC